MVENTRNDRGWVVEGCSSDLEEAFKRNDKMYDLEFGGGADKWLDNRVFSLDANILESWSFKLASLLSWVVGDNRSSRTIDLNVDRLSTGML